MAPVFDELMIQECDNEYCDELLIKNGEERRESISIKYYRCKLPKA